MIRERKEVALAYIQAFYTREELGIDTSKYEADDISDELVLLVDEIMDKMLTHTRIMAVASFLSKFTYKVGGMVNPVTQIISFSFIEKGEAKSLLTITKKGLIEDKDKIMANFFTRGALLALLGGRKSEVAMKLYGF